jgi:1,4-alpha-glucan branching enzyme
MLHKVFMNGGEECKARVTFALPGRLWADTVHLVGDFNDWNQRSHPLRQDAAGNWSITVDLEAGRAYQFRYLVNGTDWMNDSHADAYVHNLYGSDNSLVLTDPSFEPYRDAAT